MPGCVAPNAVKMEVQGIRNDMGKLKKLVDQKADNTIVAEQVDQINNKIEQTSQLAEELSIWSKNIQAETINYGSGGWIVIGTSLIVVIFVGAGLLLVKAFMKRGTMLNLLTRAVKNAGQDYPDTAKYIKKHLKNCVEEGHFHEDYRYAIGRFAKKVGNFTEQK